MEITGKGLSRRDMILVAGGAAAAAGALVAAPFRQQIVQQARQLVTSTGLGRRLVSLANADYDEWAAQVGSTFTLGGATAMKLVGVRALASSGVRPAGLGRSRAFVAVFETLSGRTLAGDLIYTANHPEYGPLPIFLTVASDAHAPARMLAVFN